MADLDLNINGDSRRARRALEDVASGSARAARVAEQLARSFDHLENEANDAQRAIDRVQDEISRNGPTTELNAQLAELQHRLSDISRERFDTERLRAQFRRSTAAAAQLDNQLADVRRELDRLNDEYARGGDPAVLRQIERQQEELQRLARIRQQIADDDEDNQHRLSRLAEEARRAQARRDEEERRRRDDEDNRSFLRRLRRRASNLGEGLGNGLQNIPDPGKRPALYAAVGAAATSVAVPALAAVGGALTGLAGFGVAGAGIAGAIMGDPERFKAEWSVAADTIKDEFLGATEVFTGPTIEAIRGLGPLIESWDLDEMFAGAAKYVGPLVHGVEGFASGIVRGVSAMVDKGEPAVKALSAGLAELGDAAGDAFSDIADGAEGGGEALRDVLFFTADIIRGFGKITEAAEDTYDFIHDHPVAAAFMSLGASLPITLLDQFSDEVDQAGIALSDTTIAANGGSDAAKALADAWEGADKAMEDYEDTLHNLVDVQLGVVEASMGWQKSLDDLSDSIKENGKNWSDTTEKGRENIQALDDAIRAAIEYRDAQVANGEQTGVANRRLEEQIAYLQSVALKAGMTKQQFDAMTAALKQYIAAPQDKTITTKYVTFRYDYGVSKDGRIGSGEDPRTQTGKFYASGGPVTETGWSMVGERGPELRWLNKGDYIVDAARTARMLSGGFSGGGSAGGNSGLTLRFAGDTNSWLAQALMAGVANGQVQIYDSTGQPVTARP